MDTFAAGTCQLFSKRWKNPADEYPVTPNLLSKLVPSTKITGVDGGPSNLLSEGDFAKLQYEFYQLQQGDGAPVSKNRHESALAAAKEFHDTTQSNYLGYQANLNNSYTHLSHYLNYHVNNIGDPFSTGNHIQQTKFMERAVLDYFAALWRAEWPHDRYREKAEANHSSSAKPENPSSYWGFVTSMGCTEGTLYGLWNGRDYLAGKAMLMDEDLGGEGSTAKISSRPRPGYGMSRYFTSDSHHTRLTPICFFSQDTHYSVQKAMVVLNIRTFHAEATEEDADGNLKYPVCPLKGCDTWPKKVPSNSDGSINVEALLSLVEFFAERGYPPLIYLNFGTTSKGSFDDVKTAAHMLIPMLDKYGLKERFVEVKDKNGNIIKVKRAGFWIHIDGALGAAYIPFLRMAQAFGKYPKDQRVPEFDFSLRGPKAKSGSAEKDYSDVEVVHSIAMSGHKWIGAPFPTGVYMTKSKLRLLPPQISTLHGTPDTTFAGSRNAFASVIFWDHLARHSFNQLMDSAVHTQNTASYFVGRLQELNDLVKEGKLHTYLKDRDLWIQRWTLSLCVVFRRPNDQIVTKFCLSRGTENGRNLVHAYAMQHVTQNLIDQFILDLSIDGAFEEQIAEETPSPRENGH